MLPPREMPPQAPPLRFDSSLENLERQQVITPAERRELQGKTPGVPIDASPAAGLSRGALSRQECESGVAIRSGAGRRLAARIAWRKRGGEAFPTTLRRGVDGRPYVTVPVSALMGTGGFRLESVFAVSPRPAALTDNGDRRLLFPIIGSAITPVISAGGSILCWAVG